MNNLSQSQTSLEARLNDFDPSVRRLAFTNLLENAGREPNGSAAENAAVNMHCHSFFSFNSYGFSPTGLAWLAKRLKLHAIGIVDFDVLDGVGEFLDACDLADLRGSAAMETRIYIPEFADRVTNSPGEPGISYHTGIGFTSNIVNEKSNTILKNMRSRADLRNRGIVEKLNHYLYPVCIDYDRDAVPLTPSGNVTERHILAAYTRAADAANPDLAKFWSQKLEVDVQKTEELLQNPAEFLKVARGKLMKLGGVGYIPPSPQAFPSVEEFHEMVISSGAIPAINYLDGTTPGEQCMQELLTLLVGKGVGAMNMIPNLAIPDIRGNLEMTGVHRERCNLFYNTVRLAQEFDLPLHIGTEMNTHGQRLVDDLNSPELMPVRQQFLDGAYFVNGHSRLQKISSMGYQSEWARVYLPTRVERNNFYTRAGYLVDPGYRGIKKLREINPAMNPDKVLKILTD